MMNLEDKMELNETKSRILRLSFGMNLEDEMEAIKTLIGTHKYVDESMRKILSAYTKEPKRAGDVCDDLLGALEQYYDGMRYLACASREAWMVSLRQCNEARFTVCHALEKLFNIGEHLDAIP